MHFARPQENISLLALAEGMKVADFGAGSGAYTFALARRVGHSGKVYAIDVQKELLVHVKRLAEGYRLSNVEVIHGDLDTDGGSTLPDATLDALVISNVLFQSDNKYALAREAHRVLKPGGQLLVIDWKDSFSHMGPTPAHVVKEHTARELFNHAGLLFDRAADAGAHHWAALFHRPKPIS